MKLKTMPMREPVPAAADIGAKAMPVQRTAAPSLSERINQAPALQARQAEHANLINSPVMQARRDVMPVQRQPQQADNGLPSALRSGVERLSNVSMADVKVHYNSSSPAQFRAHAYAQGRNIHVGPGQERHLPHEAWHVAQQKQGRVRPTMQMKSGVGINDDHHLEQEADVMGARALQLGTAQLAVGDAGTAAPSQGRPLGASVQLQVGDGMTWRDAETKERRKGFRKGIDGEQARRKRQELADEIRKERRQEAIQERRDTLASLQQLEIDERGLEAAEEIANLDKRQPGGITDNDLLALQQHYRLKEIRLLETPYGTPKRVYFQINPEFEVLLGAGTHITEMRSEGTDTGVHNATGGVSPKTRIHWRTATLNLTTSSHPGSHSYTVGHEMLAHPLSQDHPHGTLASADSDHLGMMTQLPSKGTRSATGQGSGPYYYIRGHLLNDNIGGIANQANLFPITHEANGQHKNYVEQYIKHGINHGYVYRYHVWINNVQVDYDLGLSRYFVDSDLNFSFHRLDTAGNPLSGTAHTHKIESRYKTVGVVPTTAGLDYSADYTNGSSKSPQPIGGEMISKVPHRSSKGSSNTGLAGNVSNFTFQQPLSAGLAASINPAQAVTSAVVQSGCKLSLSQSHKASVTAHYGKLVTHWQQSDIDAWYQDLLAAGCTTWIEVRDLAILHHLEPAIAGQIFDLPAHRTRISINGMAINT